MAKSRKDEQPGTESAPAEEPLEKTIARLEEIVTKLESGDTGLEKSIDLYIEGRRLGQAALRRLDALDRKVQIVAGDDGNTLETEDFE